MSSDSGAAAAEEEEEEEEDEEEEDEEDEEDDVAHGTTRSLPSSSSGGSLISEMGTAAGAWGVGPTRFSVYSSSLESSADPALANPISTLN